MWHYRHGLRQPDQQLGHNEDSQQFPSHMGWSQEWGGLPRPHSGQEPACQCRRCARCGFDPWVGKIPWSRKWHPSPIFLLGKSHRQRSLTDYSPRGCKKSDMTQHALVRTYACTHTRTHTHTHTHTQRSEDYQGDALVRFSMIMRRKKSGLFFFWCEREIEL